MLDQLQPVDERRSRIMRSVSSKNTAPERFVRSVLHSLGYRFRLHASELPGKPDIVFRTRRKAIWVHGCYWHGHDCKKGRLPKTRLDFWTQKINENKIWDSRNEQSLSNLGWNFLVIWQCQLRNRETIERALCDFLGAQPLNE